jgi:hypothetical protein
LGVVGTTVIPARSISNLSNATPNSPDVNAIFGVHVISGHVYYIADQANKVVSSSTEGNGLVWFATANDYRRGEQYFSYGGKLCSLLSCGDSYDLEFQTYVNPIRGAVETLVASTDGLTVPEPSTWAMMMVGFAGLAYAGYRGSRKSAPAASQQRMEV